MVTSPSKVLHCPMNYNFHHNTHGCCYGDTVSRDNTIPRSLFIWNNFFSPTLVLFAVAWIFYFCYKDIGTHDNRCFVTEWFILSSRSRLPRHSSLDPDKD